MRTVLIYRNELLPASETFIRAQAGVLQRFTPVFAGLRRIDDGLDLRGASVLTLSDSESLRNKFKRRVFLRTGLARAFSEGIAARNPELVHAHFAVDAAAVLPIAKDLSVPLVVTLHGYDVTCAANEWKSWPTVRCYMRRMAALKNYAHLFLCVSRHVKQQALALGFPEDKLYVHHIGVDLKERQRRPSSRENNTVLFVGRLVEKKGASYLIRGMSLVNQVNPQTRLVIIGDGPLRNSLELEAARCGVNALFLGVQEHKVVRQWMSEARVLAAPSVRAVNGDSEGLPTVLCEAQSAGLPVVAFATEGVTEAFSPERRESLPREKDVTTLAEQILILLNDDDAWCKASKTGREWVESRFDLFSQTKLLEDKYEELIESHRG